MDNTDLSKKAMADDLLHAQVAAIAYLPPESAEAELATIGFHSTKFYTNEKTGTDAVLCWDDDRAIFAVRGTEKNYADILTDLKFRKITRDYYELHRGFDAAWRSIEHKVSADIYALGTHIRVTATGHSLGGAVAVIAASDLMLVRVVTFGAPRVGGDNFQFFVQASTNHRRYVRAADIVPLLPLLSLGFCHDCAAHYFTREGTLIRNAGLLRELYGRLRSLLTLDWLAVTEGRIPMFTPRRMFTDHRISAYKADLILAESKAQ